MLTSVRAACGVPRNPLFANVTILVEYKATQNIDERGRAGKAREQADQEKGSADNLVDADRRRHELTVPTALASPFARVLLGLGLPRRSMFSGDSLLAIRTYPLFLVRNLLDGGPYGQDEDMKGNQTETSGVGNHFWRAFSSSSLRFNCSSFCPASPSLPSAVSRW
jgi:hypothetical protein